MSYEASIKVDFVSSRQDVYGALAYLGRYPEWTQGMFYISHTGPMQPGLRYETRTRVLGQVNAAEVEVLGLVPNELIHLRNSSGIVGFEAWFRLSDRPEGGSRVGCRLNFNFPNVVMHLARPVIEGMARDRIQNDLEHLAAILERESAASRGSVKA